VLVSETLAQQTQLARVVPAYHRFLDAFPTPAACAAAPLGDVLRAWEGMGYNRRAKHLHAAARAVLAFAFEHDVGVVDTNAGRVIARGVAGRPVRAAEAQDLVDAMVPPGRGWSFGQALLDLGATVCTSRAPACVACPLRRRCRWAVAGRPDPDPARGSAGVSVAKARFVGSDRQGRGRLVAALRTGPVRADGLAAAAGWADDPRRAERVLRDLEAEGLVVRDRDGTARLP